jgi:hypothetical protein
MKHTALERRAAELQNDNQRLATEVRRLREKVAVLQADLATRSQLLGMWNELQFEHESWLAQEIDRVVREPRDLP